MGEQLMDLPLYIHLLTDYLSNMHLATLKSILQELFMLKIFLVIQRMLYLFNYHFGVILVRIFPHPDSVRRDTPYFSIFSPNARICPHSVRMWENADQNNFEYGYVLRRVHVSPLAMCI